MISDLTAEYGHFNLKNPDVVISMLNIIMQKDAQFKIVISLAGSVASSLVIVDDVARLHHL